MGLPTTPYQPYADRHVQLKGPGDARPTALQVIEDSNALGKLKNKTVLITGVSAGLGIGTAAAMYETGAKLFLTARDMPKLHKVIENIVAKSPSKDKGYPRPEAIELHLDSLAGVRKAAQDIKTKTQSLNILIHNAGVARVPFSRSVDGFELHMATNHYSHFLLFMELKPLLLAGAAESGSISRVINVSSAAHRVCAVDLDDIDFERREYDSARGYGQSKTANIWMTNALTRRYGPKGITGLSVHPGYIETEAGRHLSEEEKAAVLQGLQPGTAKSVEQGAATAVWAAVSPHFEDVKHGGRYLADVGECAPMVQNAPPAAPGYKPWVYGEEEKEGRFWGMSCEAVGVKDE